ncbi:YceI family protein [Flavobacterium sp. J27]|uniref:YceI family protein n=1 Tax=Flavobacterium sp. J27 TaxID=2060419 RepID=UPI00103145B0|nr:YceI family protein [Flavobacterium sp. J27]
MTKFNIHPESSLVSWTGKKVLGLHTGTIQIQNGYLTLHHEEIVDGEISIDMTTINITDISDKSIYKNFLDHLNNSDFFAVDQYKTAQLKIVSGKKENNQYHISGNLTIKNQTHPITFYMSVDILTDFLHALGEITIDRTQYDITYGSGKFISNLGNKLIYDEFVLQFKLIGKK